MNICHVSPHLPPDQAANALLPAQLAEWAVAAGHSVGVLSYEPAQNGTAAAGTSGKVVRLARRVRGGLFSRVLRVDALRHARDIEAALNRLAGNAELIHLHSNGLIIEAAARWAERRRIPYVLTLYGTEIWHYRPRWPVDLFTRAYLGASAVTFYSRKLRERANELGLSRPGQHVVYPTVSHEFRPRDARERAEVRQTLGIAEPIVILNVKRLHELAGQRFLIDAFAALARQRTDVRLVICGTGPLKAALEDQARASGVGGKVTFAGLVPNDTIARYDAVADVFALPSLLEALPTVAVEALAAATPVVSADHPGGVELHDLFGEDVRVVPKSDAAALSAALLEAIRVPRRASARTLALVQEHFGPSAVRTAYETLYRNVLMSR